MKKRIVILLNYYQSASFACVAFLLVTCTLLLVTSPTHAQNIATQKKVVSTYQINDTDQLFPFPSSDCPDKQSLPSGEGKTKGDANCDGNVNFFDISIWQVEVNNPEGSKRADFNGDGFVNMTDYGIWRNTFYNDAKQSGRQNTLNYADKLAQRFSAFWLSVFPRFMANAQSQTPGTGNIHRSLPFISANDTSLILNQNSNGTTSEIRLDENSNPSSSLVLDANGKVTAQANFTGTGDEWVTTTQDGVTIQTLKKVEGPVFQYFKDAAGTTLAVKSWPNLPSIEASDPPLAVTLPVKNNWLTLSINPNGTSIVAQTDNEGSVLKQTQYRLDGTYISRDNKYQVVTEANEKVGLLTIQIPNSLGGKTTYNFYKDGLYAIVQTDKDNNYYIAQPEGEGGNSWKLTSNLNQDEKTVSDPIGEVGSNTPSANEIIANINTYRSLPPDSNAIKFTDGFGPSSKLFPDQTAKANEILRIDSSNFPQPQNTSWNFGIKQAFAADIENTYIPPKTDDGNYSKARTGDDDSNNNTSTAASASSAAPATTTAAKVGIGTNTGNVTVAADGTQTNKILNANGQEIASGTTNSNANTAFGSGGTDVAVNAGYVAKFVPATPGGGTPTGFSSGGPTTCFLAGTKISTPEGPIDIETLKPGMKVYSFNEETRQKEVADFAGLDINFVDEYLIINDKIQTTTYHPFYVWDNGLLALIKAGKLKVGDFLVDESNNIVPITSIQKITKKETVYNLLNVTPNDNFYAEGVLVHNYQDDQSTQGHLNAIDPGAGHEQPNYDGGNLESGNSGGGGVESSLE